MRMNKINIYVALLFLFLSINSVVFTQSKFNISGLGGINYIPMKEFSHLLNSYNNAKPDKIAFSGNIKLQMKLNSHNGIYLSGEIISNNASFSGGFVSLIWSFESVPITIGYEYLLEYEENWSPYLGLGFSYVIQNSEIKYLGDDGVFEANHSSNAIGFELHFGLDKKIIDNFKLVGEVKYRYIGDLENRKFSDIEETNLSGVGLLFGIKLGI